MYIPCPAATLAAVYLMLWPFAVLPADEAGPMAFEAGSLPTLTRIEQVRSLLLSEAERGYRVTITGIVTFSDASRGLLFVKDATGGIFVAPEDNAQVWPIGQTVEVTGLAAQGSHLPYVNQALLRNLGAGKLPVAKPVTWEQLATDAEDGNWVKVRGVIRAATIKGTSPSGLTNCIDGSFWSVLYHVADNGHGRYPAIGKPKFTKQQIAGRLRQLRLLFEEGLLAGDFYSDMVAELAAAH